MGIDKTMLAEIGKSSIEELFSDVPLDVRVDRLDLPKGMSEMEVIQEIRSMLKTNVNADECPCFCGGGVYHHFIPSAVKAIVSRSEFYTSYTPYQAEISQGLLQALFEYQSFMAELTGLDAVNSSNYDSATALGEAATMCYRLNGKKKFLIPEAMSWEKKSVLRNFAWGPGIEVVEYAFDMNTGELDLEDLRSKIDANMGGVYIEVPNFFGIIDSHAPAIKEELKDGALVVGVNPISLGALKPPGDYGADIVIGEGQMLGSPMNFGGPLLGIFATRQEHVRKMPGRVIGLTRDMEGNRAFCMTLQTREQHIRRSKATSNICTNEALMAVAAATYLAILGRNGLKSLAEMNIVRARRLMNKIGDLDGYVSPVFKAHHFNEFVIKPVVRPEKLNKMLLRKGIIGGLPLDAHVEHLSGHMLMTTTEVHTDADYEKLLNALAEMS
jgi:glycine dehydrogenase subunit 1